MDLRSRLFDAFASRPHPGADLVRPQTEAGADKMQDALADKPASELTPRDVNAIFEGNLWMFNRDAFLHYLPAFMDIALNHYGEASVFASELLGALTRPERSDVVASLDRLQQLPPELGLSDPAVSDRLRQQQLEWFDSGTPVAIFDERFEELSDEEGAAVLAFLEAFRERHGENFPFDELDTAIDRQWARYRGESA
jgi:hypothetical protein